MADQKVTITEVELSFCDIGCSHCSEEAEVATIAVTDGASSILEIIDAQCARHRLIEVVPSGLYCKQCNRCDGVGVILNNAKESVRSIHTCPVCNGTGSALYEEGE